MSQTFILDADDLEYGLPGLEDVLKLKEHYPKLKFTFFMTPIPGILLANQSTPEKYKEWAKVLKQDWIEICPHGLTHQGQEFLYRLNRKNKPVLLDYETAKTYIKAAEKTFNELELPFKKIWKSPHWATSSEAYDAIIDAGYTIACDPNQPYPSNSYLYNWSYDMPVSRRPVVKGHGHLHGNNRNTIRRCISNILEIPTDSEFKFVSEAVKEGL
jgi:hypothetical protein